MKKGLIAVGGILAAAAAAGSIYWFYFRGRTAPAADGEQIYVSRVSVVTGAASGAVNRYAGVVEPQKTVEVQIDSGRTVSEVNVKVGDVVSQGQILFQYDLSAIQEDLQEANLALERLKNEAMSLTEQINTLEREKRQASQDSQLSYTIEIETNKMNLKKNEYDQKSQQAEIDKLQSATGNTEVRSEIEGVIQKIDTSKMTSEGDSLDDSMSSMYTSDSSEGNAFITILSTGAYRIKGKVNELNVETMASLQGQPMIIRSRADETKTWRGVMGAIDRDASSDNSSDSMYFGMGYSDEETNSSSYPFYVELDSSDGLMLGQHVYIEPDNGQEDHKLGLWLDEFYIVDADTGEPYVWAVDSDERLEKRELILGQYDDVLGQYEIVEGLTLNDYIAFPDEDLEEGMATTTTEITVAADDPEEGGQEDDDWELDYQEESPEYTDEGYEEDDYEYIEDYSGEEGLASDGPVDMDDVIDMEQISPEDMEILDGAFEDMPEDNILPEGEVLTEDVEELR